MRVLQRMSLSHTRRIKAESVGEVSIKRLHEKQYHPNNIEDARDNKHNDGVGWHSKYFLSTLLTVGRHASVVVGLHFKNTLVWLSIDPCIENSIF